MIVVTGKLYVDPDSRDDYLEQCRDVMEQARRAPGCVDFHLSPDALEPGRVNILELWESVADVEAFRGEGPSEEQQAEILSADVFQHETASTSRL